MSRRRASGQLTVGLALLGVVAVSGCGAPGASSEAGMGLPVVGWFPDPPVADIPVDGTMRVAENGCFHLETPGAHLFVVWPDGFEHDGAQVRTDAGAAITDGDAVRGDGQVLAHDAAVDLGGGKDSQLGSAIGYCADGMDVVVLTEVTEPPGR